MTTSVHELEEWPNLTSTHHGTWEKSGIDGFYLIVIEATDDKPGDNNHIHWGEMKSLS